MFGSNKNKGEKLPGPCEIPEIVGRHLVTVENGNPDTVWNLRAVLRPTENKKIYYCRVFSEGQASKSSIKIQDWNSLNDNRSLIIWEGIFDKGAWTAQKKEFIAADA